VLPQIGGWRISELVLRRINGVLTISRSPSGTPGSEKMAADRIDLDEEPIWEKQAAETVTQYRAFCLYRDLLSNRSLCRVAELWPRRRPRTSRSVNGTLRRWCQCNRWVERAEAYDLYLQRKCSTEQEAEIERMVRRERLLSGIALTGVMRRLLGYEDPEDPSNNVAALDWSKLTPRQVAYLARTFTNIERQATQRPTTLAMKSLTISARAYEDLGNNLIAILLSHVPAERRALAAEAVDLYLTTGYRAGG
jgi:hypothetical protein